MKKFAGLLLATLLVLGIAFPGQVFAAQGLPEFPDQIDPDSWVLPEHMTWDDYKPVPGIDWLNTDIEPDRVLTGALVCVDFPNREFVITMPEGSDPAGNPMGIGEIPRDEVPQFYVDLLNTPNEMNQGHTVNSYWKENSYGAWEIELYPFGVYTMPGEEFQYGSQWGNPTLPGFPTRNLRNDARAASQADLDASGIDFDFVFVLSAGYDESGTWQEFGEMMFLDREDVTDEFGPPAWLKDQFPNLTNWALTRYVPWTSWWARAGVWSHASGGWSMQGESDGMGTFAHEFGHIIGLADNYNNPYGMPTSRSYTGPWELMSRGSFNGPSGNHARWWIPPTEGGSMPAHHNMRQKIKHGFVADETLINVSRDELLENGPVFADLYASVLPLGDEFGRTGVHGINITMDYDYTPRTTLAQDWRADMQRGLNEYQNYTIEVRDRMGFDSFVPDHGVLITKTKDSERGAPLMWIIDPNFDDINVVDFIRPDGTEAMVSVGDYRQLANATFKAGIVAAEINEFRQFPTDGRLVKRNEYIDVYNSLHFYILDTWRDLDGGLSYRVAVRHLDGAGSFARGVEVGIGAAEPATPGNVATYWFEVTNTGEATDIFRLNVENERGWEMQIQSDIVEVAAGDTALVPVYVLFPQTAPMNPQDLTFSVSSETDPDQSASVSHSINPAR